MKIRTERLSEMIRDLASDTVIHYSQEHAHPHGIISIIDVVVSGDESYADVFVTGSAHVDTIPKFLAPTGKLIERNIIKQFHIRKSPHVRFRVKKNANASVDVLALINSLDKQYGLSQ